MKDRLFEIWFALRCGIANREFQPLLEQYGSPYNIFNADEAEIEQLPVSRTFRQALCDKSVQESYRILEYCEKHGVEIFFWQNSDYPSSLRSLPAPPVLLYCLGHLPGLDRRLCISVVGTRRMSEYGKQMAYKIGYELASAGAVVISGMALGIDGMSAAGAMAAGGTTVAVLGCGLDTIYPAEHKTLFEEIVKNGAVLSEYPPSVPPEKFNFPQRNRIISGLSQGTVVVEAALRSGALITAHDAITQGRDIYAVPGQVGDVNAGGTNQLIRDGATVVLRARDILENYTFLYRDTLNMNRLLHAEANSELTDAVLERFGIYIRNGTPCPERKKGTASREPARPSTPRPAPSAPASKDARPYEPAPRHGDSSERALKSLTDTQRAIFEALPLDRAVPVDYITREGFSMSDIMAAMTVLEIKGLIISLPGGLYSRK